MEFEKIIELIHAVSDSNLTQFQIQDGDLKLSMKTNKETKQVTVTAPQMFAPAPGMPPVLPVSNGISMPGQAEQQPSREEGPEASGEPGTLEGKVVKSPLVGTYYQASSPDQEPFVQVGDTVKKGQVLGIVEAMKLMNEIESEFDGVVKEILVENEQLVEFGQPMFVIG